MFFEKALDHGNVDVVEVDLALPRSALVLAPVIPQMLDDTGTQAVGRIIVALRSGVVNRSIGYGDRANLGQRRRECCAYGSR